MDNRSDLPDELTIKELILVVRDYLRFFLRKWYWFVVAAAVLGGLFFWNAYREPVTYTAPLTFLLNNEQEKSIGAGALLGSLGLGAPDQGNSAATQLLELSRSRRVLSVVLFDSTTVDGKRQLIADHLIEQYDYPELWVDSDLEGFRFAAGRPDPDDRRANRVLKMLHGQLIDEEEGLFSLSLDPLTNLFTARTTTLSAELSIAITNGVYAELSDYFSRTTIADKQASLERLTSRADSVQTVLARVERQLARSQDRLAQVPLRQSAVRQQQLQREAYILSQMYGEIIKNREAAAFLLASEKPAFNLVDAPLAPLRANREPVVRQVVIGVALGVVLAGGVLFFWKLVRDAMGEETDTAIT